MCAVRMRDADLAKPVMRSSNQTNMYIKTFPNTAQYTASPLFPEVFLNMMRNRRLIPLEFPTNRTRRHLNPPHICTPSTLMSPIRLFQCREKSHISRQSLTPPLIKKILILIPNIPLHPPSNHPPSRSTHTTATTLTIPIQPRSSAPNKSLTLLTVALADKLLHPAHSPIA